MKKLSLVLNIILFVLVGVLFYLHFSPNMNTASVQTKPKNDSASLRPLRIAYVNLDSLEMHYTYFQMKKAELEKKQQSIQNDLSSRAKAIQDDIAALRKKAPTMTQSEGEAAQKKIMQKQQALQQREQNMREEFMQDQQRFNTDLHSRLDHFLESYNSDKRYSYILSYASGASDILYKDSAFDITAEVITGLNAEETK